MDSVDTPHTPLFVHRRGQAADRWTAFSERRTVMAHALWRESIGRCPRHYHHYHCVSLLVQRCLQVLTAAELTADVV